MADGNLDEAFAWVKRQLGRELWPRERQFIATGGYARPSHFHRKTSKRPESATEENRFDARLIRWLLVKEIQGVTCRPEGVKLLGLLIEGELDLGHIDFGRALSATACGFRESPSMMGSTLNGLYLTGSSLPGLFAKGLICNGPVHLREQFKANGSIQLVGAKINGQFDCSGGSFAATQGRALNCDSAVIGANVLLGDGFAAAGEVNFRGAQINGHLSCTGGTFEATNRRALNCNASVISGNVLLRDGFYARGEVSFHSTKVMGNFLCKSARIEGQLDCERATIDCCFFWEAISGEVTDLNLTGTSVSRLRDDTSSWACVKTPILSGFRYESLQSDMALGDRLKLFERKREKFISPSRFLYWSYMDFDPQPYNQLASIYDAMGRRGDAAQVRATREKKLAYANLIRATIGSTADFNGFISISLAVLAFLWSQLYRVSFGFGHIPSRALGSALVILFGTYVMANNTYQHGEMAPASPVVLTSAEWLAAAQAGCAGPQEQGCTMPLRLWEQGSVGYRDYETFSPALYALDLFLPLDTLAQEENRAPSKDRGLWGWTLYWSRSIVQLYGWFLSTTALALISGILSRKE